jgi:hypothetical protein
MSAGWKTKLKDVSYLKPELKWKNAKSAPFCVVHILSNLREIVFIGKLQRFLILSFVIQWLFILIFSHNAYTK